MGINTPGPSSSKITMSLVNDSLKFTSSDTQICCRGRQHSFVEIDHEIFSTVILSLPLTQEGQLSVSGERMCTILVNRLED